MTDRSNAYGPHPAAVAHAEKRERSYTRYGGYEPSARQYIEDAHDPALGDDASVNRGAFLRDILWFLRYVDWQEDTAADAIEACFGNGGDSAR